MDRPAKVVGIRSEIGAGIVVIPVLAETIGLAIFPNIRPIETNLWSYSETSATQDKSFKLIQDTTEHSTDEDFQTTRAGITMSRSNSIESCLVESAAKENPARGPSGGILLYTKR